MVSEGESAARLCPRFQALLLGWLGVIVELEDAEGRAGPRSRVLLGGTLADDRPE